MKNNKAFSYVELILAISIMAIMVGFVTLSIGLVNRNNVSKGASKIQSALNSGKTITMSKGADSGQVNIFRENGSFYYSFGNDADAPKQKICSNPCSVVVVQDDDTELTAHNIQIKFKQSTGAFDTSYKKIYVTNGDKKSTVVLYKATGKSDIE